MIGNKQPVRPLSTPAATMKSEAKNWTKQVQRILQQTMPLPTIDRKVPNKPVTKENSRKVREKKM
jgi:hypothetical protein